MDSLQQQLAPPPLQLKHVPPAGNRAHVWQVSGTTTHKGRRGKYCMLQHRLLNRTKDPGRGAHFASTMSLPDAPMCPANMAPLSGGPHCCRSFSRSAQEHGTQSHEAWVDAVGHEWSHPICLRAHTPSTCSRLTCTPASGKVQLPSSSSSSSWTCQGSAGANDAGWL